MQNSTARPATPRFAFNMWPALAATIVVCVILALLGYTQAVVLGIIQGVGEFLPISSSAHLIIAPWIFGWSDSSTDSVAFDVALHIGTLLALVAFFWRDWVTLLLAAPRPRSQDGRTFWLIIIASIPAGITGILLEDYVEVLRLPLLIATTLAVMGVVLWLVDKKMAQVRSVDQLRPLEALLIGGAQAIALIPGVSRSGSTMTMGRLLKLDRSAAARFSFLMSMPITGAVGLLKLNDIVDIPSSEVGTFIVGTIVAAIVGALSIGFLLSYLRHASFAAFAVYRLGLAALIVILWYVRT